MDKGRFIVVEGIDGAGKTKAIEYLRNVLFPELHLPTPVCTCEPGGTPLGQKIRALLKFETADRPLPLTELLLLYAARSQLVRTVIQPTLNRGQWVIADRHNLSSLAYQGAGRQLPLPILKSLSQWVLNDLQPSLTLYLDLPPAVALARIQATRGRLDQIESEGVMFLSRVRDFYKKTIANSKNAFEINANQSLEAVQAAVKQVFIQWL